MRWTLQNYRSRNPCSFLVIMCLFVCFFGFGSVGLCSLAMIGLLISQGDCSGWFVFFVSIFFFWFLLWSVLFVCAVFTATHTTVDIHINVVSVMIDDGVAKKVVVSTITMHVAFFFCVCVCVCGFRVYLYWLSFVCHFFQVVCVRVWFCHLFCSLILVLFMNRFCFVCLV